MEPSPRQAIPQLVGGMKWFDHFGRVGDGARRRDLTLRRSVALDAELDPAIALRLGRGAVTAVIVQQVVLAVAGAEHARCARRDRSPVAIRRPSIHL